MIEFNQENTSSPASPSGFAVSVVGVGGAGINVIDKISLEGMPGADLIGMNCDARTLTSSMAARKLQLGRSLTQGLGCGGDPELGQEAAQNSEQEIRELLGGRSMVFICAGLGGGTGSGAAPEVARIARESGAFVVVFATLPFSFEGRRRMRQALQALDGLRRHANALVTFENDRMGELIVQEQGVREAFDLADKIIGQSVRAITTVVTRPGLIHIGMDDLIAALRNTDSRCLFGFGRAKGEKRAAEALAEAMKSPLLNRGQMMSSARNVLVHICGGKSLKLAEIQALMNDLSRHVSEDAQILFGAAVDEKLNDDITVTLISSLNHAPPGAPVLETPARNTAPAPEPEPPAPEPVPFAPEPEAPPAAVAAPEPPANAAPAVNGVEHPAPEPEPPAPEPVPSAPEPAAVAVPSTPEPPAPADAPDVFHGELVVTAPSASRDGTRMEAPAPSPAEPEPRIVHAREPEYVEPEAVEEPEPPAPPERVIRVERDAAAAVNSQIRPAPDPLPRRRFPIAEYARQVDLANGTVEQPPARPQAAEPAPVDPAPELEAAPAAGQSRLAPIRPIAAATTPRPAGRPQNGAPALGQAFLSRPPAGQDPAARSRYETTEPAAPVPAVESEQDLDIPTFLRKKLSDPNYRQ